MGRERATHRGPLTRDDYAGRYVYYGIREFGMAAVMNGLALHGGFIPYGGTFAVFSDYARNAIRMSALMRQPVVHVLTHDSIGLGEDGPTHQPVEHASALRVIPNLDVWRPCDGVETAVAWSMAIERRAASGKQGVCGPSALLLSRQNLTQRVRDPAQGALARLGGYVLSEAAGQMAAVIIATGSEVGLAMEAQALLAAQGVPVRVVSMPSTTVFDKQSAEYKSSVLPEGVPRIAVEAGVTDFWWKYRVDAVVGIDTFGESAPAGVLFKHFGFTADNVARTVKDAIALRG